MRVLVIAILTVSFLSACATGPDGRVGADPNVMNKGTAMEVGGGLLGAVICNQLFEGHGSRDGWTAACGIGGFLLAKSFTQQGQQALEQNKVGQSTSWVDPDNGQRVSMTPTRTFRDQNNRPCRDYESTVTMDGQPEVVTGTACRQDDGSWRASN